MGCPRVYTAAMKFDPEKLKAIREAAGFKTPRAAVMQMFKQTNVDVSDRAWAKWENSESEPGSKNLGALATFFDVSIDAFFSPDCGHKDTAVQRHETAA